MQHPLKAALHFSWNRGAWLCVEALMRKWGRTATVSVIGAMCLGLGLMAFCNARVASNLDSRASKDTNNLPAVRVGVVLGTAPTLDGIPNVYFLSRIRAAALLYKSGKVKKLLVSGDHGREDYDEPLAMKTALVSAGVPENDIAVDDAGFRTLDTVVRAQKVFGLNECTFITDDFHMARTLYIARQTGLKAYGYITPLANRDRSLGVEVREVFARTLSVLDTDVLHRQPKFLGPRIQV